MSNEYGIKCIFKTFNICRTIHKLNVKMVQFWCSKRMIVIYRMSEWRNLASGLFAVAEYKISNIAIRFQNRIKF